MEKANTTTQYYTDIMALSELSQKQKQKLKEVTDTFSFRVNDYYLSLINWDDPADPIRRIIIPDIDELEGWGRLDPSDEQRYTIMPGLEHKYPSTALLLVSNVCEGICRYCFRKRVFIHPRQEILQDIPEMLSYISEHEEITNVLLTGGDPLVLSTNELHEILLPLRQIDHVKMIRIGTRIPVFNPFRILEDDTLVELVEEISRSDSRVYIMTHFCHPRELTDVAVESVSRLIKAGAIFNNQCPIIRGVNDDSDILAELFTRAASVGVIPYYLFQCRPALGNHAYTVPIEEGYTILEQTKVKLSGLAKRVRFVMSHSRGKLEIIAKTDDSVFFKYHRAADDADSGRILVCHSNPDACWLDDYEEIIRDYPIDQPYRLYDPE